MNKKKRIIYIVAAIALILVGFYLDRKQTADAGDDQSTEGHYIAENDQENVGENAESEKETVIDSLGDEQQGQSAAISTEQEASSESLPEDYVAYYFRNDNLLEQHYEKHGVEMGFESMEAYEEAACAVIYHPDVLTKTEKEDGDYVYYVEESNEFVILSPDGYIRTYFNPSAGIEYFNRQ